eukprot:TRINITY_DN166_c0_g1_i1.p1 TRINITY_DN166_c0_g1~~TRINITY_DN166_c0_g1_i1.p1  ORF type:complete len:318 (-),score=66.63 TRINITY_DN166_c0_g1_i1:121-1074(-)
MLHDAAFDDELPQRNQLLRLVVPKRLMVAAITAEVADERNEPGAEYVLGILPSKRKQKLKDTVRAEGKAAAFAASNLDSDAAVPIDDDQRKDAFRAFRTRRFQLARHFPVLVNPKLVPDWKDTRMSRQQNTRKKEGIAKGTIVSDQKAKTFEEEVAYEKPSWSRKGGTQAKKRFQRKPVMHEDLYDSVHIDERERYTDAKKRWLTKLGSMLPGKSRLSTNHALQHEIAERRAKGSSAAQKLSNEYSTSRQAFQQQREREFGSGAYAMSKFEVALYRKKKENNEKPEKKIQPVEEPVEPSNNYNNFGSLFPRTREVPS